MSTVTEITVPFYDLDPMNVVWHGNYIKYLEQARCDFLASKGMTYTDMERIGYAFPVVELKVKYIRPCLFGQHIRVQTTWEPCDNCLIFKYEITDAETGKRLSRAQTKQMCVDLKTKESLYCLPDIVLKYLKAES